MSKYVSLRVETKSVTNVLNVSKNNVTKRSSQIIESKDARKISATFEKDN